MTTLVAKNEIEAMEFKLKGYKIDSGDMLLVGSIAEIDKAGKWMDKNGISSIYFNPECDSYIYSGFMFVSPAYNDEDQRANSIRLYK